MGTPLASGVAVCSICGEPLNAKGDCLACLLRTGLEKTVVETRPSALAFGDFEVERARRWLLLGTRSRCNRGDLRRCGQSVTPQGRP